MNGESSSSSDLFVSQVTEHSTSFSSSEDSSSMAVRIRPFQKNEVSRLDTTNLDKKGNGIINSCKLNPFFLCFFVLYLLFLIKKQFCLFRDGDDEEKVCKIVAWRRHVWLWKWSFHSTCYIQCNY